MTGTPKARTRETPIALQKRVWDKAAPSYDRQIAFVERIQFGGGREWLGERARGRTLEVAIGTGLNLPHYPPDVTVSGIELSPAMLAVARQRSTVSDRVIRPPRAALPLSAVTPRCSPGRRVAGAPVRPPGPGSRPAR